MKWLEKAANVAVIVGVLVFIAVVVNDKLIHRAPPRMAGDPSKELVGKKMHIPGVQFSPSRQSLVLVLSTTCHYCKDSLPFYKELATKLLSHTDVIAVLPQPEQEAQAFLRQASVPTTRVASAGLDKIGVYGTPTLLLVDGTGEVREVWLGALDETRQREVLSRVQL